MLRWVVPVFIFIFIFVCLFVFSSSFLLLPFFCLTLSKIARVILKSFSFSFFKPAPDPLTALAAALLPVPPPRAAAACSRTPRCASQSQCHQAQQLPQPLALRPHSAISSATSAASPRLLYALVKCSPSAHASDSMACAVENRTTFQLY